MTGSMINNLYQDSKMPAPRVGMGMTFLYWTDRKPGTVIAVRKDGREVDVQGDKATRIDNNGMSESQRYVFERNPAEKVLTFTLRKNGRWVKKGEPMKNGSTIAIGRREKYYDFSF